MARVWIDYRWHDRRYEPEYAKAAGPLVIVTTDRPRLEEYPENAPKAAQQ